jgi:hypothetical protein
MSFTLLGTLGLLVISMLAQPRENTGGASDFDFLVGTWRVHNRSLKGRLQGSREWIEFEGRSEMRRLTNDLGNVDQYTFLRDGKEIEGVAFRLWNPTSKQWVIYWADSIAPGVIQPPVSGSFAGNAGEFIGEDTFNGQKILCRFRWTRSESPRWEQSFSADGGKTWETNWIMTFTRIAP